jgi:alpha-galactosidase/6-phospho-beta-glucosidase family protein
MIWILQQLQADPPDVFVINAVYPAAYYTVPYLKKAGIAVIGICHVNTEHPLYHGLMELIR